MVGEQDGEGEEIAVQDDDIEDQEVEVQKTAPNPLLPSAEEVDEHRASGHHPYRSWCRECVEGRAVGEHHRRGDHEKLIPTIAFDYFFLTAEGLQRREDLAREFPMTEEGEQKLAEARRAGRVVKVILLKCSETKVVLGHVVPCKGVDENLHVVKIVVDDVAWIGHTRVLLKCDNERSLVKLVREALKEARVQCPDLEQVAKEHPEAYDSQANGMIENAVRNVRAHCRTLKICLERQIRREVPVSAPIVAWMIQYSCFITNARRKGEDGYTPWARCRGRPFRQRLVGFGETVLYKLPTKGPQHDAAGNLAPRWRLGVFLGYARESNSYLVNDAGETRTSRALMRRPEQLRWNAELIEGIKSTPWSWNTRGVEAPGVRFRDIEDGVEEFPSRSVRIPRRFKITKSDLDNPAIGYTTGCAQCDHILAYGRARPGSQHNDRCRARVMAELSKSPEGQRRLQDCEDRINRALSEHVARDDKQRIEAEERPIGPPLHVPHAQSDHRPDDLVDPFVHEPEQPAGDARQDAHDGGMVDDSHGSPTMDDVLDGGMDLGSMWVDPYAIPRTLRVGSAEGWLPRADDGSLAETPRDCRDSPRADNGEAPGHHRRSSRAQASSRDAPRASPRTVRGGPRMATLVDDQPAVEDDEPISVFLVSQLGCDTRSFRRERRQAYSKVVSEIYSPPRVTGYLTRNPQEHLGPGFAIDLTTTDEEGNPWDLSDATMQDKALNLVETQKPLFLIGSPECKAWCSWQRINDLRRDPELVRKEKLQAKLHLKFVTTLYREQLDAGRYFLHENPSAAGSWSEKCMERLAADHRVHRVNADQCQYGSEVSFGAKCGSPVRKATGFLTNSGAIAQALSRRCSGRDGRCSRPRGGTHVHCEGRVARDAARYPRGLCQAILRGCIAQMKDDGIVQTGTSGLQAPHEDVDAMVATHQPSIDTFRSGKFRDDMTGQVLVDSLVYDARRRELEYFGSKGVWTKVPRKQAYDRTGKAPITVRWVDVNKGDDDSPRYRSRLVARQLKSRDKSGDSYFSPTPPLEGLRAVLSLAATSCGSWRPVLDPESEDRTQISTVDITRAYFNAVKDEDDETYVELPSEEPGAGVTCARLLRHMYGTRGAADGWQEEYSTALVAMGFRQGMSSPCLFAHLERQVFISVHGDDFTSVGSKRQLDWFEETLKQRYELTVGPRLGPADSDAKEGTILNRIIRWTPQGIEYEADPRQAEKLIRECGLEGSNAVCTPSVRESAAQVAEDKPLEERLHTAYRASAARANYLAADRVDLQYPAKEVCRWMSSPTANSWASMKRMTRFLGGLPRLVFTYPWQTVDAVDIYVDTDWAGCPRTRRSTSGGCVMLGAHAVKTWASTQTGVSLSSGEAEFYGVLKGSGIGLGFQSLLADLGVTLPLRVWTDSSAAIGICTRQGLGKLRHLATHLLWIQQAVRSRRFELRKVNGEQNPADLFTKHMVTREKMAGLVRMLGCEYRGGRAEAAPLTRTASTGRTTMAEADVNTTEFDQMMPHLAHTREELDARHPAMNVPQEIADDKEDGWSTWDGIARRGEEIVKDIMEKMTRDGRRRCESSAGAAPTSAVTTPTPTTTTTTTTTTATSTP